MIVRILLFALLAWGLYNLISGILGLPPISSIRVIETLTVHSEGFMEGLVGNISRIVEPAVRRFLPPYKREAMAADLEAAGSPDTPEQYAAKAVAASGMFLLLGILFLPVLPPFGPISFAALTFYSIQNFFKDIRIPGARAKRESLEAKIPGFTSYVVQATIHKRDVISIIQEYRPTAGPVLGPELDRLLTDMRTKNQEAALIGFESRINSPMLSELVRGLIGLVHGEDMRAYLEGLLARMEEREVLNLKHQAEKRPGMLESSNWAFLLSMLGLYAAVLGVQAIGSLSAFKL